MLPRTLWFTGLPGSGKTTLAALMVETWRLNGLAAEIIDGDALRAILRGSVGFSKEDRRRHVLSAAFAAMLLNRNGVYVAAAFVSPYGSIRQEAREIIGPSFVEVFVNCPLSVCRERDPKGLYKKAAQGSISGMTGVDDPYEAPEKADLVLETGIQSVEESMGHLNAFMRNWKS
jgi:adenylyl-sulfate kinase